jgi:hypothetical protein
MECDNMRKYFVILIMICFGILFFVNFSNTTSKDKFDISLSNADKLLKDLQKDYQKAIINIRKLQSDPKQTMEVNNLIMEMLYSNEVSEKDIELLLNAQRELYDEELLEVNPKDVHFKKAKEEIEAYNKTDTKILEYHIQEDNSNSSEEMKIMKVVYYLNKIGPKGQVYEEFLLVKDNELWKIKGWQKTDEFIIVGD